MHRIQKFSAIILAGCLVAILASSYQLFGQNPSEVARLEDDYEVKEAIYYRSENEIDEYARERCVLDVYYPKRKKDAPVVVWFHGGGLTGGKPSIPDGLKRKGFVIIAAGYRLSPKVQSPVYIEDAAAAVAWAVSHASEFNGSPKKIIVSGHSAGAYLTLMLALDKQWLKPYGVDPDQFAGIVPLSAQAITHFTIRAERQIERTQPIIDAMAPLYHVRASELPILLVTGDRERELLGRYEENAYLLRMLKEVGHSKATLYELQGYDHGGMVEPGIPLLVDFVREVCGEKKEEPKAAPLPNNPNR